VVDSDNYAADFDRGRRHAEEAIRYARSMGRPGFIAIVLSAICLALRGNLMSSNTAAGFHARIAELASAGALN